MITSDRPFNEIARHSGAPSAALWMEEEPTPVMWRACVESQFRKEGGFIDRLLRLGPMINLTNDPENWVHWANFAWCTGARAGYDGLDLATVEAHAGGPQSHGLQMAEAAQRVRGVAGAAGHAITEQRTILQQVLNQSPGGEFESLEDLLRACVVGGWWAFRQDCLVTVRSVHTGVMNWCETIFTGALTAEVAGLPASERRDGLVWFIAKTYPSGSAEQREITGALAGTLEQARRERWDATTFLRDMFHRGERLGAEDRTRAMRLVAELRRGELLPLIKLLRRLGGKAVREWTAEDALRALRRWLAQEHSELLDTIYAGARLGVVRITCDFLIWTGVLKGLATTPQRRPRGLGWRKAGARQPRQKFPNPPSG